jgi:hypothetical protein
MAAAGVQLMRCRSRTKNSTRAIMNGYLISLIIMLSGPVEFSSAAGLLLRSPNGGVEMDDKLKLLRSDVIIEPLVDRFYAWLHTVAPVQAAMNLAFVQVPLLESYLQSPHVHINASNNPALRGGLFVNVEAARAAEVRDLLASIKRERAGMLRFARAVAEAEEIVRRRATGFDLGSLYPELPPELSGLVELVYDTSNQPSVRFIEPLAYESIAYTEDRQSVQLSLETGVERPFILSTPRLQSPDVVELRVPFRHPGLAELVRPGCMARRRPGSGRCSSLTMSKPPAQNDCWPQSRT